MSPFAAVNSRGSTALLAPTILALLLGGCGTLSAFRADSVPLAGSSASPNGVGAARELAAEEVATTAAGSPLLTGGQESVATEGDEGGAPAVAQTQRAREVAPTTSNGEEIEEDYDPWEPFNERMFEFNRRLDRYLLKPAAQVYNKIMPEPFQLLIASGFDNIRFVPRAVNNLLQGKWRGAGREVGRFLINSTFGIGGLFDAAKYWEIEKSSEDFGQTLGVWGAGPGPYLVLPFLPPLTVRDGIGKAVDGAMDPLSYVLPFLWTRVGMEAGDTLNDRSLNLDLFQGFEESVVDMYSAVRHGYLRRREQVIKE